MTKAMMEAQAGELSWETFSSLCDDPGEAADLYRLYLSRLQWDQETST